MMRRMRAEPTVTYAAAWWARRVRTAPCFDDSAQAPLPTLRRYGTRRRCRRGPSAVCRANPNPSRRIKMTSDPKGSSPPGVASPRRKRPAVTIEGTATEVTETPPPAAGAAAKEPAPAPAAPAAPDAPPADAPAADAPAESLEATAAHAELAAAPAPDREASGAPPETSVPP